MSNKINLIGNNINKNNYNVNAYNSTFRQKRIIEPKFCSLDGSEDLSKLAEDLYKYHLNQKNDKTILRENNFLNKDEEVDKSDLILLAVLGIRDTIRNGVKESVMKCKEASVNVIMVTGDNIKTAISIAKSSNIIEDDLIQVVKDGTGKDANIAGKTIAGKTGTAEIKASKNDKTGTEIGWFDAFDEDGNLIISMVENVEDRGGSNYVVKKVAQIFDTMVK